MAWGGAFFLKIHQEAGGRELILVAFWDKLDLRAHGLPVLRSSGSSCCLDCSLEQLPHRGRWPVTAFIDLGLSLRRAMVLLTHRAI